MTPQQKLAKLARIYDTKRRLPDGTGVSSHARHNLWGALLDLERKGKPDKVIVSTIRRVMRQLARMERVLGI